MHVYKGYFRLILFFVSKNKNAPLYIKHTKRYLSICSQRLYFFPKIIGTRVASTRYHWRIGRESLLTKYVFISFYVPIHLHTHHNCCKYNSALIIMHLIEKVSIEYSCLKSMDIAFYCGLSCDVSFSFIFLLLCFLYLI